MDVGFQSMGIYLVLTFLASEVVFLVVNGLLKMIMMMYKKIKKIKPKYKKKTCLIHVWVKGKVEGREKQKGSGSASASISQIARTNSSGRRTRLVTMSLE